MALNIFAWIDQSARAFRGITFIAKATVTSTKTACGMFRTFDIFARVHCNTCLSDRREDISIDTKTSGDSVVSGAYTELWTLCYATWIRLHTISGIVQNESIIANADGLSRKGRTFLVSSTSCCAAFINWNTATQCCLFEARITNTSSIYTGRGCLTLNTRARRYCDTCISDSSVTGGALANSCVSLNDTDSTISTFNPIACIITDTNSQFLRVISIIANTICHPIDCNTSRIR